MSNIDICLYKSNCPYKKPKKTSETKKQYYKCQYEGTCNQKKTISPTDVRYYVGENR